MCIYESRYTYINAYVDGNKHSVGYAKLPSLKGWILIQYRAACLKDLNSFYFPAEGSLSI